MMEELYLKALFENNFFFLLKFPILPRGLLT